MSNLEINFWIPPSKLDILSPSRRFDLVLLIIMIQISCLELLSPEEPESFVQVFAKKRTKPDNDSTSHRIISFVLFSLVLFFN